MTDGLTTLPFTLFPRKMYVDPQYRHLTSVPILPSFPAKFKCRNGGLFACTDQFPAIFDSAIDQIYAAHFGKFKTPEFLSKTLEQAGQGDARMDD